MSRTTVAIAGTFTAEPVGEAIDLWAEVMGRAIDVVFAPYNQVHQQILDPESVLSRNRSGLNVVLVRLEDWDHGGAGDRSVPGTEDLVAALRAATASTPWLLCFCPPSPAAQVARYAAAEQAVVAALTGLNQVQVVTAAALAALYPVASPHDEHGDAVGKIPYTPAQFAALGTLIARRVHALTSPPCKVVVADCDHTLWAGVAGEDGPLGIVVDPPYRALQEMLVAQHDAGALVCLCSKNEDADVVAVFAARPDMPLQRAHVSARRVSLRPKSEGLRSLAAELGLALDSFVFLDDSPLERAEVRSGCPEVITAELPADPAAVPGFLRHFWALDRFGTTAEDRRRTELYREGRARDEAQRSALDYEAFLDGLDLSVTIAPLTAEALPRAAQLTQRTNQLNVSGIRRTEAELRALWESGSLSALVVDVRDRFGDYGLTGLVLFAWTAEALAVDTFLVSCRALGRGVEERMLAHLGHLATERGRARVDVPFVPSPRNDPAHRLLQGVGAASPEPQGAGSVFRFSAAHLAGLRRLPRRDVPSAEMEPKEATPKTAATSPGLGREALLNRIAAELSDPEQVLAAIRQRRPRRSGAARAAFPPGSIEEKLAAIWKEVLRLEDVGPHEVFFELGGQSVSMVQVLSRIHEALGVAVTPEVFFSGPTIDQLGQAITRQTAQAAAPDDLAALLDQIEGLSPEQVEALLQGASAPAPEPVIAFKAAARPEVAIGAVAIVTCERPAALSRALASYADNCQRHGRAAEFVVFDDSRSPAGRAGSREAAAACARAHKIAVAYAGRQEKDAFAAALVARGVPPSIVGFALAPERASTAGANRNALLLHFAGEAVFSADDDTLCRIAAPPERGEGIAVAAGEDPAGHWFFPSLEAARDAVSFGDRDLLGAHEELLGRDVRALIEGAAGDAALRARMTARGGRVIATFNGLVGDSGWGAPFGGWTAPMGYLAMRGPSRERLVATEDGYRAAVTSRNVVRVVDRPTLADPAFSMMGFAALDDRALLPPFCPVGRGEDNVFGATIAACFPEASVGHVPLALVHAPIEARRFWAGEMARTAASTDLSRILIALVRSCPLAADVTAPAARMRALGAFLTEVGALDRGAFEAVVRERLAAANRTLAAWLEEGLREAGGGPAWWAADVRRYVADLSVAADREDYPVALDAAPVGAAGADVVAEARAYTREAVRQFGQLLTCWPGMVEEARALRARGQRPALPVPA